MCLAGMETRSTCGASRMLTDHGYLFSVTAVTAIYLLILISIMGILDD